MEIPQTLRRWFVAHFLIDVAVALPLLVAPTPFLHALGWTAVDPVAARLVGAALLAIGTQSLLSRKDGPESFRVMLNLNLIWTCAAIVGLIVSIGEGAPPAAWAPLSAFIALFGVWFHYRVRMKQLAAAQDHDLPAPAPEDEDGDDDDDSAAAAGASKT